MAPPSCGEDRMKPYSRTALSYSNLQRSDALIRYVYTGLSPNGNREVERYSREWFQAKMENWETSINYYLRTGKLISVST
jgi:hypothetical protein